MTSAVRKSSYGLQLTLLFLTMLAACTQVPAASPPPAAESRNPSTFHPTHASPMRTPMDPRSIPSLPPGTSTSIPKHDPTPSPSLSQLSGYVVYSDIVNLEKFIYQIFLANLDSGEVTQLTNAGSNDGPEWSPDGQQIVFVSTRDGGHNLYIMDRDGSNQSRLTDFDGDELLPNWSPDGSQIVFAARRDDEIYTLNVSTGQSTRLTFNDFIDFTPRWSPDGKQIAFVSWETGTHQIFTMNADGSSVQQLINEPYPTGDPVWCLDNSCLVYARYTGGRSNIPKLMVFDFGSKETRPLLSGPYATDPDQAEFIFSASSIRGYITIVLAKDMNLYALDIKNNQLYSLGIKPLRAALFP